MRYALRPPLACLLGLLLGKQRRLVHFLCYSDFRAEWCSSDILHKRSCGRSILLLHFNAGMRIIIIMFQFASHWFATPCATSGSVVTLCLFSSCTTQVGVPTRTAVRLCETTLQEIRQVAVVFFRGLHETDRKL